MSFSSMFGSHHMPGRVWRPKIEVTQDNVGLVVPEELIVDPYLPTLGVDPFDPAGAVVIPAGRFLSIGYTGGRGSTNYRFTRTDTGKTTLTLHDGKNLTPCGMSINQMYKEAGEFMTDSNTVKYKTGFVAEVPFVLSINNAHGTLVAGDKVTGYWGSTTSLTSIAYVHRGKPVKWNARTVYSATGASSSMVDLPAAIYPGITPSIVTQFTSAGAVATNVTGSVSWDAALGWVATFAGLGSTTVSQVVYSSGQSEDQIAGSVVRIQSISDILTRDDFLKWVSYAPQDQMNWPAPPATQNYPVTQIGTGTDPDVNSDWETPATVVAGSQYRVANYPISLRNPFLIAFKGTLIDKDGITQTYATWTILPYNAIPNARGYFTGLYHSVNWRTGLIELASNITSVSAIKVLYAYTTDNRDGAVQWAEGVMQLTDGSNLGGQAYAGVPSHLNLSDVVAAMRIYVK